MCVRNIMRIFCPQTFHKLLECLRLDIYAFLQVYFRWVWDPVEMPMSLEQSHLQKGQCESVKQT